MVMAAGLGMGFEEVKRYCEGSVDLVVQLSREGGRRGVARYCAFEDREGRKADLRALHTSTFKENLRPALADATRCRSEPSNV